MKKNIILLAVLFTSSVFAQFSVKELNGTPINDGDLFAYSETGTNAELKFKVFNTATETITTQIEFVSATNYDGTNFQVCYGTDCIDNVTVGSSYPVPAYDIPVGGSNGNFDHFLNTNPGNGTFPMDLVFKYKAMDNAGNIIGNTVTITYRYDPTTASASSFSDLEKIGVAIKNTLVTNSLEVLLDKNVTLELFDMQGKRLSSKELTAGTQQIAMDNLASNVYFLHFTDENGAKAVSKIIKK